jgi:hypothetical protein
MAGSGYSGTPLAKKIGIKPGQRVRLVHGPDDWDIPDLPDGVVVDSAENSAENSTVNSADSVSGDGRPDVTVAFYRSRADLAAEAGGLAGELADHGMVWIAWPRRAAGHASDITENALRDLFLPLGVVDVKVAALGQDWSGLKFVRRRENRRS